MGDSSPVCDFCLTETVIEDQETGDFVCETCGRVIDGHAQHLRDFQRFEPGDSHPNGVVVADDDDGRIARACEADRPKSSIFQTFLGHRNMLAEVKNYAKQLKFNSRGIAEAEASFQELLPFYSRRGYERNIFQGIVLYAAARRNLMPLTLRDIAETICRPIDDLGRNYRRLVFKSGTQIPFHNLREIVDRYATELESKIDSNPHQNIIKNNDQNDQNDACANFECPENYDQMLNPEKMLEESEAKKSKAKKVKKSKSKNKKKKQKKTKGKKLRECALEVVDFALDKGMLNGLKPMLFTGIMLFIACEMFKMTHLKSDLCESLAINGRMLEKGMSVFKTELVCASRKCPGILGLHEGNIVEHIPRIVAFWKHMKRIENMLEARDNSTVQSSHNEERQPTTTLMENGSTSGPLNKVLSVVGLSESTLKVKRIFETVEDDVKNDRCAGLDALEAFQVLERQKGLGYKNKYNVLDIEGSLDEGGCESGPESVLENAAGSTDVQSIQKPSLGTDPGQTGGEIQISVCLESTRSGTNLGKRKIDEVMDVNDDDHPAKSLCQTSSTEQMQSNSPGLVENCPHAGNQGCIENGGVISGVCLESKDIVAAISKMRTNKEYLNGSWPTAVNRQGNVTQFATNMPYVPCKGVQSDAEVQNNVLPKPFSAVTEKYRRRMDFGYRRNPKRRAVIRAELGIPVINQQQDGNVANIGSANNNNTVDVSVDNGDDKETLSDLDDAEIEGYILEPYEVFVRELLAD